ncbi:MAG: tRNA preQ1(34) S-adenosylmethionine ribosyltransferase-isomerase QueA [Thermoplasmata archaeon]
MRVSEFDFDLPRDLIAQSPMKPRDSSRLMVLIGHEVRNQIFSELVDYFEEGDVLVINDSKVIPARMEGRKKTGGRIEILLTREVQKGIWECLLKGRVKRGTELDFGVVSATVVEKKNGRCSLAFSVDDLGSFLREEGKVPLPPYIKREISDHSEYQTVYAKREGSIAAPTAGLHFSVEMISSLQEKGVRFAPITLHIGPGTFLPIRSENVEDHRMEVEYVKVPESSSRIITEAKLKGRKVVAVGTTSVKALESAARGGELREYEGWSDLYVYPSFRFKSGVDALVTNFHLPKSTLLVLVSAFAGRERLMASYREAIRLGYRFYTFGDAMLIFR